MDDQVQALYDSNPIRPLLALLLLLGLCCAPPGMAQQERRTAPALGPVYLPQPVQPAHPLAQGLLAWWRVIPNFYGSPRLYDLVGSVHAPLMNYTTPATFRTPRPGGDGEINCDGTDDHMDLGIPSKLNLIGPMSFFAWIRPQNVTSSTSIVGMGTAGFVDQSYGLMIGRSGPGELTARWFDADIAQTTGTALAVNVPAYVGFTRAGVAGAWTAILYVNGVQRGSAGTAFDPVSSSGKLMLCRRGEATQYYTGALDEVMLWDRALSAAEVKQLTELLTLGAPGLLVRQATIALLAQGSVAATGRRGSFFPFMRGQQ